MTIKPPTKPKHLFVVKEETPSPQGKMLSAENLSSEQQLTAQRYLSMSSSSGIMVGALVKPSAWDVRPLLLQDGQLTLLRFSDPAIALQKSNLSFLRASCERILASQESSGLLKFGEIEGQVWTRRRYFQSTLAETDSGSAGLHPLQVVQRLIRILSSLHDANIIHGHLCPQNVAIDKQEIFVLDHAYLVSTLPREDATPDFAPELSSSMVPSFACDIYGLGLIARGLPPFAAGSEQALCLERMLSNDPALRPDLESVKKVFMPREAHQPAPVSVSQILPVGGVSSGKLLSRNLVKDPAKSASQIPMQPPKILNAQLVTPVPRAESKPRPELEIPPQAQPQIAPPASATAPASNLPWIVLCGLIAACLMYVIPNYLLNRSTTIDKSMPFDAAWLSNQPSRMQNVALAAVQGDLSAQTAIVSEALRGTSNPLIRTTMLRTAFTPLWEQELSDRDRELIFRLALAKILPNEKVDLPPLQEAHPAIAFAVTGDMPDLNRAQGSPILLQIPLSKMAALPAPYGEMYAQLEKTGVRTLGELPARGLSHILSGETSEEAISALIFGDDQGEKALLRLAVVYSLSQKVPKLEEALYATLLHSQGPLSDSIQWFGAEEVSQWEKAPRGALLSLLLGEFPSQELSLEQFGDLLKFPDAQIRAKAQAKLGDSFFKIKAIPALQFLAAPANHLSRFQTIGFLSVLKLEGEAAYALLGNVLTTNPEPRSILGLLLARAGYEQLDPVNVELARYLSKSEFKTSVKELKALITHPEQLARAISYSRLDPKNPEQKTLLENAAVVEPNKRLRESIEEKLKGVTLTETESETTPPAAEEDQDADLAPF